MENSSTNLYKKIHDKRKKITNFGTTEILGKIETQNATIGICQSE